MHHGLPLDLLKSLQCTHTHLLVKRVNWGYLYTPIQTGTFECGYTPAYWGYTKYECDYTPITWGYPNTPSMGDMLLNAFIWHFGSHAGNAQMGTSPVGSVSTFPLAESDVCPRFTPFTNAHTHTHTHTHTQQAFLLFERHWTLSLLCHWQQMTMGLLILQNAWPSCMKMRLLPMKRRWNNGNVHRM